MSPALQHECTRVPVTALASHGALLVVAEGPFLRFFRAENSRYVCSKRVFKAQAVHGISVCSAEDGQITTLVVWGGRLVCAFGIEFTIHDDQNHTLKTCLSNVAVASDWILDLIPCPNTRSAGSKTQKGTCAAVTAHNALLQVSMVHHDIEGAFVRSSITTLVSDLTSSSRSILYSAHLLWDSPTRVLIAAGTAFGEIVFWSWSHDLQNEPVSRIHRIFLGHEGSIFGVRISKELQPGRSHQLKRVVASCSDDRTIRLWDVSNVDTRAITSKNPNDKLEDLRTHHTGFSNESFDTHSFASSDCLASGWGHASRVWSVLFLEESANGHVRLLSTGEDATSRIWELVPSENIKEGFSFALQPVESAAHHEGKNIWSLVVCKDASGRQQVTHGAADSKIIAYPLDRVCRVAEYTHDDILALVQSKRQDDTVLPKGTQKVSKKKDFLRTYCFIDEDIILLTTDSGDIFVGSLELVSLSGESSLLSSLTLLARYEDLSGYSVCTSSLSLCMAFLAGTKGSIYMYSKYATTLKKIHTVTGKVGSMFATKISISSDQNGLALLITLVGRNEAQLLYVDTGTDTNVVKVVIVPVSDGLTGSLITSATTVETLDNTYLFLGFRRGSIAAYYLDTVKPERSRAILFRVLGNVHGDETITCMTFEFQSTKSSSGYLLSVGRDGRFAVNYIDLSSNSVQLVHSLPLPIGPNIEGLFFHEGHICAHGFSSKKWVLYDIKREEEIMGLEIGGAHRSWAFKPHSSSYGGTMVWTRASNMHIYNQKDSSHTIIRSGGHGREIKAVAVSPKDSPAAPCALIATGAEDTNIKLFQYIGGDLVCQITLRKHTTGIQHLQWSQDGDYLFSSGGCEEFYVWRIRQLPSNLGFGAVCEHVYTPESEHADLRIMSFDVKQRHSDAYIIAMVFSDSSLKVYAYAPQAAIRWQPLAVGTYFTSCLTQCLFLSDDKLWTAGTDGHAALWPLPCDMYRPITDLLSTVSTLEWKEPLRIHQNSSKAMDSYFLNGSTMLIVSGGDDGSLAFLLFRTSSPLSSSPPTSPYVSSPILLSRAHASAITACAIITHSSRIFILTSGNDEWVRLWEVTVQETEKGTLGEKAPDTEDQLVVKRHRKIKTNVADVSSMAVLNSDEHESAAQVLLCGVGMEVIRVRWESCS